MPEAARVFGLLSDRTRLRLLRLGGLVAYRRDGKRNFYRLASPVVGRLLGMVRDG